MVMKTPTRNTTFGMAIWLLVFGCTAPVEEVIEEAPAEPAPCQAQNDENPCTHDTCLDGVTTHTPIIGDPSWYQCATDITFIAMGDPQYGGGAEDKNIFQVTALNAFPGTPWRSELPSAGTPVATPLGLLIAGDLTQNGKDGRDEAIIAGRDEIGEFERDYGLTGDDGLLKFPVYEGYGNHDFDPDEPDDEFNWRFFYDENPTPSVERVANRNLKRPGLLQVAQDNQGHYSWDWGNVHLVNVNLFAGDEASQADENSKVRDPRQALTFLENDLATHVGNSGRPVLIMQHYGFDQFGYEDRWWTVAQKEAFLDVIRPYHILALIHGHTHATYRYEWEGYDILNVGSPYYLNYNFDGQGHFTVFRITDTSLEVSDVAWNPNSEGTEPSFGGWYLHKTFGPTCMPNDLPACHETL